MIVSRDDTRAGGPYSPHNLRHYQCADCGWHVLVTLWVDNDCEEIVCGQDHNHKRIEKQPYRGPQTIYEDIALEQRRRNQEAWKKADMEAKEWERSHQ